MANTNLKFTPSTTGNKDKWTWSAWVKLGKVGADENLFTGYDASNYYTEIQIGDTGVINFINKISGTEYGKLETNRKFRDTSGWYHFVVVWDSGNSTASDRMRIYVNGVEETSFATDTNPSINQDSVLPHATRPLYIGSWGQSSKYFSGSMSHIHFADGQAYAPTVFGETDATTGEWKAKTSPSVTYGTNGFFILKDGNGITDQSGEGNNFTVDTGTLTNLKDNPANVFTTLNVLERLGSNITISNGNTQFFNQSSDWRTMISNLAFPNTGKFYAEMQVNEVSSAVQVGIMAQSSFTGHFQADLGTQGQYNGYAYLNNGQKRTNSSASSYGNSFSSGILGIAVDMDNKNIYFAKDGTWQNSGDPTSGATGTGAAFTDLQNNKNYCFAVASQGSNPKVSWNFGNGYFATTAVTTNSGNGYAGAEGASKFNYTVPTGYSALNTKGLNE